MSLQRRVVVTGIGVLTPIGHGRCGLWQGVVRGKSGVRPITRFDARSFRSRIAAEIDDFDAAAFVDRKRLRRLDRFSQFALAAAVLGLEDAGLTGTVLGDRVGIYLGSALGGIAFAEAEHAAFVHGGLHAVNPLLALSVFGGASATNVAMEVGVTGPTISNANSCASGAIAIGEGFRAVRRGEADIAIAGGVEAPLAPLTFGAFSLIKAMSTRNDDPATASRPFDRDRDGFVMAEGAGVLILEERARAIERGADLIAEVVGYGTTNDAYHMTAPLPSGAQAARAMTLAMIEADISAADVGYVNAHASSTPLNDVMETQAIKQALGEQVAHAVPISGTKGLHGHALGATGAIEAAITALCLRHGILPPTANLHVPGEGCDLAYITGAPRVANVEYALSNSFGFGGINACLALRRTAE